MYLTGCLIFGSTYTFALDSNLIAYNQKLWCLLFFGTTIRKGLSECKAYAFTESKSLFKKSNITAVSYPVLFGIWSGPICESTNPPAKLNKIYINYIMQ